MGLVLIVGPRASDKAPLSSRVPGQMCMRLHSKLWHMSSLNRRKTSRRRCGGSK